jgi:hypothetical protein
MQRGRAQPEGGGSGAQTINQQKMRKHNLRTGLIIGVLHVFNIMQVVACGPGAPVSLYIMTKPTLAKPSLGYLPQVLLNGEQTPYEWAQNYDAPDRENLSEWAEKFCHNADTSEIRDVVYKSTIDELMFLHEAALTGSKAFTSANTFERVLVRDRCHEVTGYLVFAKECEPYNLRGTGEKTENDLKAMMDLMQTGLNRFRDSKSHWVRTRYLFQVVRMARFMGREQLAVDLYEKYRPQIDKRVKSCILYWLKAQYALALQAVKRPDEAAVLLAEVFNNSTGRRYLAFEHFAIDNDAMWARVVFKTAVVDRPALYAMRALRRDSRPLHDMDTIFMLSADHPILDVLLMKELRRLETQFLGRNFLNPWHRDEQDMFDQARKQNPAYLQAFRQSISDKLKTGKLRTPLLWQFGYVYTTFMSGDLKKAAAELEELHKQVKNLRMRNDGTDDSEYSALLWHIRMLGILIDLTKGSADLSDETLAVFNDGLLEQGVQLPWKKAKEDRFVQFFPQLVRYSRDALSTRLLREQRPGMALYVRYGIYPLYHNPEQLMMDELIDLLSKPDSMNKLDKTLVKNRLADLDVLYDIQGAYLIGHGRFKEARTVLEMIRPGYWTNEKKIFEPTRDTLIGCVGCDFSADTYPKLNRLEVAYMLDTLIDQIARAPMTKGGPYYLLGLACHNLSWFGSCWNGADFYRSGSVWDDLGNKELFDSWHGLGNQENVLTLPQLALDYFERARLLYKTEEKKARATYRAAMVEQDLYFAKFGYQSNYDNQIPRLPEEYRKYFRIMEDNYQNTITYQQQLQSCLYFRYYTMR